MNGRLDKVAMTSKLMQLKRELHYKCEIGEKGEWECRGANEYLNRTLDILDEYYQCHPTSTTYVEKVHSTQRKK